MDVLTFSETRANLKSVMDRVVDDHCPIIVARKRGRSVVIMSLEDWNATNETLHLLSSPENARRLRRSIAELDAGEDGGRDLV